MLLKSYNVVWLSPWAYEERLPWGYWVWTKAHDSEGKFWRILGFEITRKEGPTREKVRTVEAD